MAAPTPRRRARGGGLPLIALGLVLALATGFLVIFMTSGAAPVSAVTQVTVVVAAQDLPAGTVLGGGGQTVAINAAFVIHRLPAEDVPADAYRYGSANDLLNVLNNHLVLNTILAGEVLRNSDPRLIPLGDAPGKSWVNAHPAELPPGSVLFALHSGNASGTAVGAQEGDHVDVLATVCLPAAKTACEVAQTTVQNLLIYGVPNSGTLLVVVTHQEALVLKMLVEQGKIDLVLRKPGDTAPAETQAIDTAWIISHFGFTQP